MHVPVLLHEVIEGLNIYSGDTVVDATLGGGGYAEKLCEKVGKSGTVIGLDADAGAVERVKKILQDAKCTVHLVRSNFRKLDEVLSNLKIEEVDAMCFDLGLSSLQLEESGRGFSFLKDEPLAMTFAENPEEQPFTARDIVNEWEEADIANVIFAYGEERYARRVAKGIGEAREKKPIETTGELVEVIKAAVPERYTHGPIHPATRTFQALRIAVNDELGALEEGLAKGYESLKKGGRMAVVSFHSLEDRIVKNFFRDRAKEGSVLITKKPIVPTADEQRRNLRSRSAKLRILEK